MFAPTSDGHDEVVAADYLGATWLYRVRLADGTTVHTEGSHLMPVAVGTMGRATLTPGHGQVVVADQ